MRLPFDTTLLPHTKGVFIVGGSIRDLLCHRIPIDYDVVVKNNPADFAHQLASKISGRLVEIGKHGQIMRRVISKKLLFDITPMNGTTIEEDLLQRDFTVNAMAVAASTGSLIDPLEGRRDLASQIIRMASMGVFHKDPVRLVRAYRLAASLNFNLEVNTRKILKRDAHLVNKSAKERIREELFKILECTGANVWLADMAHSGLLFFVLPELLALKKYCLGHADPEDFFKHTLNAVHWLEKLLKSKRLFKKISADANIQDPGTDRATLLKWAILLGGLCRPPSHRSNDVKFQNADNHALKSAAQARKICQRLRFSKRQTDTIHLIIANHQQPFMLFRVKQERSSYQGGFARFFMQCRDLTPDILLYALAIYLGRITSLDQNRNEFQNFIQILIGDYYSILLPRASKQPPLTGKDLIREFGLNPSVVFRRILARIEEEHLTRERLTRKQALGLVKELIAVNAVGS
jgi:poly(A) polymerase